MIDGQSKIHLQEMDVIQRKMLTWAQLPPDCCSCPPCSWRWLCHWDWEPCCWSSSSLAGRGRRHSGNCSSLLLSLPPPERRHSGWLSPDSDSCGVGPQEDDEDSWRRGLEVSSAFRATHKISHRSTSNTGHGKSNQEITIHLRQPVTLAYSNQLVINFKKFTWLQFHTFYQDQQSESSTIHASKKLKDSFYMCPEFTWKKQPVWSELKPRIDLARYHNKQSRNCNFAHKRWGSCHGHISGILSSQHANSLLNILQIPSRNTCSSKHEWQLLPRTT